MLATEIRNTGNWQVLRSSRGKLQGCDFIKKTTFHQFRKNSDHTPETKSISVPIKPQTNSRPVFLCPISGLVAVSMSNPIPGYQSQLCAVLQEHIACSLLRVDPNPIISDDCTENSKDVCIVLKVYKTSLSQVFNLVAGSTLNSSAAYLRTAVKGVPSGTPKT